MNIDFSSKIWISVNFMKNIFPINIIFAVLFFALAMIGFIFLINKHDKKIKFYEQLNRLIEIIEAEIKLIDRDFNDDVQFLLMVPVVSFDGLKCNDLVCHSCWNKKPLSEFSFNNDSVYCNVS